MRMHGPAEQAEDAIFGGEGEAVLAGQASTPASVAASFAIVAMGEATRPVRHVNLLIALLLILAPWVLGYPGSATINSTIVGIAMAALSRLGGAVNERFDGGWSRVWRIEPGARDDLEVDEPKSQAEKNADARLRAKACLCLGAKARIDQAVDQAESGRQD